SKPSANGSAARKAPTATIQDPAGPMRVVSPSRERSPTRPASGYAVLAAGAVRPTMHVNDHTNTPHGSPTRSGGAGRPASRHGRKSARIVVLHAAMPKVWKSASAIQG